MCWRTDPTSGTLNSLTTNYLLKNKNDALLLLYNAEIWVFQNKLCAWRKDQIEENVSRRTGDCTRSFMEQANNQQLVVVAA